MNKHVETLELFAVSNTLHSTHAFSEGEYKLYPLAVKCLKSVYGSKNDRSITLPASSIIFQASISMITGCKIIDNYTYVKIDLNTFRLHDKITDVCEQFYNSSDYPKQLMDGKLDENTDKCVEEIAELMLTSAMFRTGRYIGLPNIQIADVLKPLRTEAAVGYVLPGIVFALSHEFTHRFPGRLGRDVVLGAFLGNYNHILEVGGLFAIDIDQVSNLSRGPIIFSRFQIDDIEALQNAVIQEIECDISAVTDTFAALKPFNFNLVSELDAISWTLGIELLMGIADALVCNDPSMTANDLRLIGLRDMIVISFAVSLLTHLFPSDVHEAIADACERKLLIRRTIIIAIIVAMVTKRNQLLKGAEGRPTLSEIRRVGERLAHRNNTTRFMWINISESDSDDRQSDPVPDTGEPPVLDQ